MKINKNRKLKRRKKKNNKNKEIMKCARDFRNS